MKGIGAVNTLQDIANYMKIDPEATKKIIKDLLENRFIWVQKSKLKSEEAGKTDSTHMVVKSKNETGEEEFYQLELVEDKNAKLFRVGLTVKSAEQLVK